MGSRLAVPQTKCTRFEMYVDMAWLAAQGVGPPDLGGSVDVKIPRPHGRGYFLSALQACLKPRC
jgi:hypothetical protein